MVAISCAPEPLVITAKSESCGWGRGFDFDRLLGTDPPSSAAFKFRTNKSIYNFFSVVKIN